ncbi:MAG: succinylglutamate desuccinylase [Gammaproteobacteria bacterium RIFCSPLOWO2_02_FULL_52_10]|nr:MAG: succinylglutamate desuccinylase [Gammaproteobacteria bacterium RIFCSPLOWO2_02_FULL_52_10]
MRQPLTIGNKTINEGDRTAIDLQIPDLYTHNAMTLPVYVIHARQPGPVLFLSGAIHGDEINSVEIIRRVLKLKVLNQLRGTLIAVPVVNIFGFINQSRYTPDRRDLNRSFPGSETGSMAGRMANLFLTEIVSKCTHGIDIHTAAIHRDNLPQVRALLDDPETERMARAFTAPVIINTRIVPGSLRESAEKFDISVIVYEAGEALRFDEVSIRAGVKGIVAVMRELAMLPKLKQKQKSIEPLVARSSTWIRAPQSGILRVVKTLGANVEKGELLGIIADPFGAKEECIHAPDAGIIIGRTNIPLVNEGEALFNLARFKSVGVVADQVEEFQHEMDPATDDKPAREPPIV